MTQPQSFDLDGRTLPYVDDGTGASRADDILAVMDHAGIADAWVGGHGAAGAVARIVARDHADRVNGILLLSVLAEAEADAELAAGMPVLLVHGTDDEVSPIEGAQRVQAAASDRASLVSIPGGGHLFPATHPGEAAFAISEYLDWD